jgi:hypothetical protein
MNSSKLPELGSEWLENYEFDQSRVDPGIYTTVHIRKHYVLAVYVDNCLHIVRNGSFVSDFKRDFGEALESRTWD